ncbi:MAG: chromate transporter [Clostridia bacterium]|nr:chromate transporter [Clostridia bacterium]
MKKYVALFWTMLKIGLFTFGGGYAMIALIESELVSKKEWLERNEFLDLIAVAESTPGPIAINAATYIGYRRLGFWGALTATVAICIPSFVILYVISLFFDAFLSFTLIANAFRGIQVCVIWLILSAGIKMWKQLKKTVFNAIILCGVMLGMLICTLFSVKFSTIFYILISGGIGLLLYLLSLLQKKNRRKENGQ